MYLYIQSSCQFLLIYLYSFIPEHENNDSDCMNLSVCYNKLSPVLYFIFNNTIFQVVLFIFLYCMYSSADSTVHSPHMLSVHYTLWGRNRVQQMFWDDSKSLDSSILRVHIYTYTCTSIHNL